jgi:hypothetical protein
MQPVTRRVPKNVAASETMDLSAQHSLPDAGHISTAPTVAGPTARTSLPADSWPARRRPRFALPLLVAALLLGGLFVGLALLTGNGEPVATGAADGAPAASLTAGGHDSAAMAPLPAADAAPGVDASGAASDAAAPPVAPEAPDPEAEKRRRLRARVATHLRAADKARRAGQTLKQIAEADSALRLDPKSRRAAYLLGDALVQSGDKLRGCKYLRRARSLSQARARAQKAGCK